MELQEIKKKIRQLESEDLQSTVEGMLPFLQEHATINMISKWRGRLEFDSVKNLRAANRSFDIITYGDIYSDIQLCLADGVFLEWSGHLHRTIELFVCPPGNMTKLDIVVGKLKTLKMKFRYDSYIKYLLGEQDKLQAEINSLRAIG